MDYCETHPSSLQAKYCTICDLFLCDFCQHPHTPSSVKNILNLMKVCAQTQILRANTIEALEELQKHASIKTHPTIVLLLKELDNQEKLWYESIQWGMIRRQFPIRGVTNRLLEFGLQDEGGNEVNIQRAMRKGAQAMIKAHENLKEGIEKVLREKAVPEIQIDEDIEIEVPNIQAPLNAKIGYDRLQGVLIDIRVALREKNFQKALDLVLGYQRVVGERNLCSRLRSIKAKILANLHRFPQATEMYRKFELTSDKQKFELAVLEFELGNYEKCKVLVSELLKILPNKPEYNIVMGDVSFMSKDYVLAKDYYQKAEKYNRSAIVIGRLVTNNMAKKQYSAYESCLAMLNEATRIQPKNNMFYAQKAAILIERHKTRQAEEEYKKSLEIAKNPYIQNNLAISMYWGGKIKQATQILRDLTVKTYNIKIIKNYLQILFRNENIDVVKTELRKFRKMFQGNLEFLTFDAQLTFHLNTQTDCQEVLRLLSSTIDTNPNNKTVILLFSKLSVKVGNTQSLLLSLNKLTSLLTQPTTATYLCHFQKSDILNTLGFIHHRLGDSPSSLKCFKENSNRTQTQYLYNLVYKMSTTDANGALNIINKLVARTEKVYKYIVLRLKVLCGLGRKKEAINALKLLRESFEIDERVGEEMEKRIYQQV